MRWNQWPPARISIPIVLLAFSLAISAIVWWVDARTVVSQLQDDFQHRIRVRIHDLGANIEYAMDHGDQAYARDMVSRLGTDPFVDYALLIGRDGHVVAATRQAMMDGKGIPAEALRMRDLTLRENTLDVRLADQGRIIWAHVPLRWGARGRMRNPRVGGVLVVRYDLKVPEAMAMAAVKRDVAWFSVAMVLFVIVLTVLMHIAWGSRIQRIIQATKRVAQGNLHARAGITSDDEVGEIGKAFDSMADTLERQAGRLLLMSHVIDQLAESVIISDTEGVIQYVNPYFTTETGYVAEEAVGKTPAILKSGVHSAEFYSAFWEQISAGKVWRGNMTDRRKDGTLYTTRMTVSPVFDARGRITHYVGIQSDITRQIELEEEIRHMQKMESLGTLVGGIAHEFNNMLAGIKGNLYLAGKRAKVMPEIQSRLEAADRLSSRAADMIQQMLTFARKDMVQKHPLSLKTLIGDAMQMLRISIPEDIELLVDLGEEDLVIHGDPTQLQQILLNLLANARDAIEGMGRRGQVRVGLAHRIPDSEILLKQGLDPSVECAVLSISDNGCGIPADIRDKIFEPFYTTKDVGKGTGLGLAMVFGAVHGHNGAIELESTQGRGTTFRIWLPLDHMDDESGRMTRPEVLRGRGETVLVADDEQAVLESLGEVLDAIGYQTVTARDGEEAVALFAQASDRIAAVVLDVVMPHMNGAEAARQMRAIRADLPIIFTTGYDRNSVLHHCEGFAQSHLLIKPVAPAELSHLMRELLDEVEA